VSESGWDHEHCHVCDAHIEPGDEYWQSIEYDSTGARLTWELCLACYDLWTEKSVERA